MTTTERHSRVNLGEMERHVTGFPGAFRDAWRRSAWLDDVAPRRPGSMVIVGMGGSAAAGDMVRGLSTPAHAQSDVTVLRGHQLPAWIGESTLVVVCSYSGNTREAVVALTTAIERRCPTVVITGGGTLEALASAAGIPTFKIDYVAPPRHSLAWMMAPLLRLAIARGAVGPLEASVNRATARADEYLADPAGAWDMACELAEMVANRVVVVTASEFLAPVARRWKNQLNENGKHFAFADELPEAAHNTVEGWDSPGGMSAAHVILTSEWYSAPASVVTSAYFNALAGRGRCLRQVSCGGESPLAELFGLVLLGDLVSLSAANSTGVDPVSIRRLESLKREVTASWPEVI